MIMIIIVIDVLMPDFCLCFRDMPLFSLIDSVWSRTRAIFNSQESGCSTQESKQVCICSGSEYLLQDLLQVENHLLIYMTSINPSRRVDNILLWRLILKYFLRSFSPFR